jgi:hypothetical protein
MSFDYKGLTLSAVRSSIAYMESVEVDNLWANSSKDKQNIIFYVFQNVLQSPKYYCDYISDANAYSWIQDRTLHVVFRGTSSKQDIKIDINEIRAPLIIGNNKVLVHRGFLKQFRGLEAEIFNEITRNLDKVDTIHFSGHSLGAGLATLASGVFSKLVKNDVCNKRIVCHTIGSSRIGNKGFVDWFEGKVDESIRIQNFKDPIPLFPVSIFYSHINGGLELYDDGAIRTIKKDIPWYIRLLSLPFNIYYKNPFSNHSCNTYIERLIKLAEWDIDCEFKNTNQIYC